MASGLRSLNHAYWADWVTESVRRLRSSDFSGITHLLNAYGGMGSINDLLTPEPVDQLLTLAYDLAKEIENDVLNK